MLTFWGRVGSLRESWTCAGAGFFPFGWTATDFGVTVRPRPVVISEGGATGIRLEVGP